MRRTFNFLLLFFLSVLTVMAAPGDLQEQLAALKGISGIEKLQSDYYPEKYVVRITPVSYTHLDVYKRQHLYKVWESTN